MSITEQTLKKWRREALRVRDHAGKDADNIHDQIPLGTSITFAERILRMTQELLDQHLLRKVVK